MTTLGGGGGATGLAAGGSGVRAGLDGGVDGAVDGGVDVARGCGASVTATALVRWVGATGAAGRPGLCGANGAGALVLTRAVDGVAGISHWRINSCTPAL